MKISPLTIEPYLRQHRILVLGKGNRTRVLFDGPLKRFLWQWRRLDDDFLNDIVSKAKAKARWLGRGASVRIDLDHWQIS